MFAVVSRARPEFDAAAFRAATGVSRETLGRLQAYADLLNRWTQRINLVAGATLPDLWRRHFLDSAQLAPHIPPGSTVIDIGSGAGFPGLVLALMGAGSVTLVESDKRKAAFLREAARRTGTDVAIFADRLENLVGQADVITARAFAPLPRLLAQSQHLVDNRSRYVLLKGQDIEDELTAATTSWKLRIERYPSRTDPRGTIVQLTQVQPR
jgi:16S rRNA (guanine527-N7)-methyltransferase